MWRLEPSLFRTTDKVYANRDVKRVILKKIALHFKMSEEVISSKITNLRCQYTKYLRLPWTGSGGKKRTKCQIWLLQSLSLLKKFIEKCFSTSSHMDDSQDDKDEDENEPEVSGWSQETNNDNDDQQELENTEPDLQAEKQKKVRKSPRLIPVTLTEHAGPRSNGAVEGTSGTVEADKATISATATSADVKVLENAKGTETQSPTRFARGKYAKGKAQPKPKKGTVSMIADTISADVSNGDPGQCPGHSGEQ